MSNLSGVVREGWLKRIKNQKKRYFVLGFNKETGDAQLQYYENPKKFSSETVAKRVISLQHCLGIIKKVDEKFGNILVLYTKEAVVRLKADTDDLLEDWLKDLNKLHQMEYKNLQELKYDIVWNVKVIPRGLGGLKNVTGSYKLCLKENTLFFVNSATQEVVIEEKLHHVRRFGYWEYRVFMEFGRFTTLGAGEIWMEVEDPLIAQKIEDSLSRSVKPKPSRPERQSMTEGSFNRINEPSINNNDSPKSRRPTFIGNFIGKKKGKDATSLRQHSNSISGTPTGSAEEQITINRNGSLTRMSSNGDDEDSEEKHYPKIIPPLPSSGGTKSESSGSLTDDVGLKPRKKISLEFDTKSEGVRTELNNYTHISRPKRRSERKQDINVVRQNFVEQYQSSSLPRRTSSSSSSEPSWRRSVGSENFGSTKYEDSDRDSPRDSDREDGESAFFQQNSNQYLKMTPRKQIGSDSSADEPGVSESGVYDPGTYIPLKPPSSTPDLYVQMNRTSPNPEKSHNTSARSSGSYYSPEEGGGEYDPDVSTYVNMKPRSAQVTSSSSSEDFPAYTDTGDERFDHLNRDNYVNIGPQSPTRGLKKSHSQIQRGRDSAYVNVDMNRSKSFGSKSRRFQIVVDDTSHQPGYDDECREVPSSYVNVKANGADRSDEPDGNYANFVLPNRKQSTENSPRMKTRGLNYASVEFSKDIPPREESSRRPKNRQENYSKIDFEKSNVLADISSSRQRKFHHS